MYCSAGKAFELSSRSRGKHTSIHEISRPLIRKAELMNAVRGDEAFIVVRGNPPLRCGRATYFRCPEMVAQVAASRFYKDAFYHRSEGTQKMFERMSEIDRAAAAYWRKVARPVAVMRTPRW